MLQWHMLRLHMLRENSVHGYHDAYQEYLIKLHMDPDVKFVDRKALGRAYEEYVKHGDALDAYVNAADNSTIQPDTEQPDTLTKAAVFPCPACQTECSGVSMDSNFKAKHRAASGKATALPDENDPTRVYKIPYETELKEHVMQPNKRAEKSGCATEYEAGNDRRKHSKEYDVTGIGGLACRHLFLHAYWFLYHGERFGYGVGVVLWFIKMANRFGVKIQPGTAFFYDVACKFHQHFKNNKLVPAELKVFRFVTGSLHGPTHTADCQFVYTCLYNLLAGMHNGEGLETIWANTIRGATVARSMALRNFLRFWDRFFAR